MTTVRQTAAGAPAPDSFPRWFLLGAAALVLFSLAILALSLGLIGMVWVNGYGGLLRSFAGVSGG